MPKRRNKNVATAIDAFSGCGGLTLGLKQAGFTVLGAIERDPLAAATYEKNHPEVILWTADIQKVTGPQLRKALKLRKGQLDLFAGCPPCQGFSVLRTRNGNKRIIDRRNDLVFDYVRLVKALLPKTILMENVPALAENRRMKVLKRELARFGYSFGNTPQVLDAAAFGVPQRRKRMLLVGSRIGAINLPPKSNSTKTVRSAIGKMPHPGASGDPLHDLRETRAPRIAELIALVPQNGGSRADLPERLRLRCHKKLSSGFSDVYGRMSWDDVAPTITSGCFNPSKGRFLHPRENRAITLREAALLQSFPKRYFFSLDRGKELAALMIGNALPPQFVKTHALAILKTLQAS